jgi:hypothetical protein
VACERRPGRARLGELEAVKTCRGSRAEWNGTVARCVVCRVRQETALPNREKDMEYKSKLISHRQPERKQWSGTTSVQPYGTMGSVEYRLRCGRLVRLQECHLAASRLGFLAGTEKAIRAEVIRQLPERMRARFQSTEF